jgi:RNA polymerase sigma-70 factor (ECF subfamily)
MTNQITDFYTPILAFVKNRIHIKEDAEDITQDVFYKLSKSKNAEIENIKSWLYTIATNAITDFYRKKKLPTEPLDEFNYVEEKPDDQALDIELSKCIKPFINGLANEYKLILTYSELENMPQKDIAEKLNMNYVTLRSKIQRGRKKLRERYAECCTIIQGGKGSILDYTPNNSDSNCSLSQSNSCM